MKSVIMSVVADKTTYFSEWLQEELDRRGWRQVDLARRSGLPRQTINTLLRGRSEPRAETCLALARGLDLPAETVLMAADLLPEGQVPDRDPSLQELMNLMKRMSEDERREILDYAMWRFRRRRE